MSQMSANIELPVPPGLEIKNMSGICHPTHPKKTDSMVDICSRRTELRENVSQVESIGSQ